ncbi:hypothetical protein RRG08_067197 [Elysia crispata]|uniref:Uncharacterized protein n=1 Tax=Elysia crispata TaxID=231223 RepID=A0AAE0Y9P2_9GAST|nr:hypothetical protein RRG08_067197 [Elysia crispata]
MAVEKCSTGGDFSASSEEKQLRVKYVYLGWHDSGDRATAKDREIKLNSANCFHLNNPLSTVLAEVRRVRTWYSGEWTAWSLWAVWVSMLDGGGRTCLANAPCSVNKDARGRW